MPTTATPTTETVPERLLEAASTLRLFVIAAGIGDEGAMWALLSGPTRERFGGTVTLFSGRYAPELEEGVGAFASVPYGVVVGAEPAPGWAVFAIAGERTAEGQREFGAFAAPLRRETTTWRLELAGPVALVPILGPTRTVAPDEAEAAVEVESETPVDAVGLWLDGRVVPIEEGRTDESDLVLAHHPDSPLQPGPHVAVAFARAGNDASAIAWVIQVAEEGA
jgi:hypothetical protein